MTLHWKSTVSQKVLLFLLLSMFKGSSSVLQPWCVIFIVLAIAHIRYNNQIINFIVQAQRKGSGETTRNSFTTMFIR